MSLHEVVDIVRFEELQKEMPAKQVKLCEFFELGQSARDAAIKAGYNDSPSIVSFVYNCINSERGKEYRQLFRAINKSTETVTSQMLLEEMKKIAFFDASDLLDEKGKFKKGAFKKFGKNIKKVKYNAKVGTTEVELYNKLDAIEMLNKVVGNYEEDNKQKAVEGVAFYLPDNGRDTTRDHSDEDV